MSKSAEQYSDPGDWIHGVPQRLTELAGSQFDEYGLSRGYYASSDPDVSYLEARTWSDDPTRVGLFLSFQDKSSYHMEFSEGRLRFLTHSVDSIQDGRNTQRALPYSGGKLRHNYEAAIPEPSVADDLRGYLSFRNILSQEVEGEPIVPTEEADEFILKVMKNLADTKNDPEWEVYNTITKPINSSDINLHALFTQVMEVDPNQDLLDPDYLLTEELDPKQFAYISRFATKIARRIEQMELRGKRDDVISERIAREIAELNKISPHLDQDIVVESSNVRAVDSEFNDKRTHLGHIRGILKAFGYVQWEDEITGTNQGIVALLKLSKPYPDLPEFVTYDDDTQVGPLVTVPVDSIASIRVFPDIDMSKYEE